MEYQKLDPEFKDKWIKALRSGEFIQGTAFLCSGPKEERSYCCLGVAGKLLGFTEEDMESKGILDSLNEQSDIKVPPILLGNTDQFVVVGKLTSMNDSGDSFDYIADWIEQNL